MVLNNTCEYMMTLCQNAYGLVHARLCNCAAASLPWKLLRTYLESCANIVQAVVYRSTLLPPALLLAIRQLTLFTQNLSKFTLAHDAIAAAVLHEPHLIIRVGAGLI